MSNRFFKGSFDVIPRIFRTGSWLAAAIFFVSAALPAQVAAPLVPTTVSTPPPGAAVAGSPDAFDAEAATAAYLARLSPAARAKSDAYFEGGYWLLLWDLLAAAIVAWIFLGTGFSARLRDWAERTSRFRFLQTALYSLVYLAGSTLLLLPWAAYEGYFREHQYGMSNQNLAAWLSEQAKGLGIDLVFGALALCALYAVLRRSPRNWWIWGAVLGVALEMLGILIAPVYLEPVFNDFKPVAESPLKERILSMARANEIPATDVYEFDASKQTKRISAHVSGLFGTTRISLNDNLMERSSDEEILSVLGHEMGHYVLHHAMKGLVFLALSLFAGFAFLRWSFDRVRVRYGARWGIRGIADPAGLPLLLFLFSIFFFVFTPLNNTVTRTMEAEADNYGLNAAGQPDGFAQAALHLSEYRKMTPGPIEEALFYDHPSGWNRIHRSMIWKREHLAQQAAIAAAAAAPKL
ncbi:MAG: M48 family metallopeptidase [Thermoanaerobaculia bacterium]